MDSQDQANLWYSYDPKIDFEQGGEVELANVIGSFLRTRCVSVCVCMFVCAFVCVCACVCGCVCDSKVVK